MIRIDEGLPCRAVRLVDGKLVRGWLDAKGRDVGFEEVLEWEWSLQPRRE